MTAPVLLWLRRELRLTDNPALAASLSRGRPLVIAYVLDDETPGPWKAGGASRWWLHHSLESLSADLAARGGRLVLRRGRFADVIPALAAEIGAEEVHAGMPTEPWARKAYRDVKQALGGRLKVHLTSLAFHPEDIRTQAGTHFGVYTPFSRACLARGLPAPPVPAPARIETLPVASDALADWRLLPTKPDWAGGLRAHFTPGEAGAAAQLARFLDTGLAQYADERDRPDKPSTSRLSPHLAFGEISPVQVWHAAEESGGKGRAKFVNELLWREFAAHLLWHHQGLPEAPLKREFAAMPWRDDAEGLRAWRMGRTGVPIVDAGMRELWHTGWMHNRVRMIVASFLIKHLMIDWRAGEAWFWDTLVDADLAQNAASWQWVAGSGADAAPYFRIFNPVLQGVKFDPEGDYVRRFVPELAHVPARCIHAPWEAPTLVLEAAGVRLGGNYPRPIIDLAEGRERALAAFASLKQAA